LRRYAAIAVLLGAPVAFGQGQAPLDQARQALTKGDLATARAAASQVLAHDAGSAEAEVILGLADTVDGQMASAEKHFLRAVSLAPADYRARTYLGSTYLRQQRLVEAKAAFTRVIQLSPGNAVARYNLGVIAALERKPAVALEHFSAVHQANPKDPAALVALLESQLDLKQSQPARDSVQKLDKLLPSESEALLQVGTVLAARGEYEAALPLLRRFAAANPASRDAAYNLGLALLHTGRLEEAETVLNGLLRNTPGPATYNLLGTVQEKRGKQKEALQSLEAAARLAPENEDLLIDYGSSLVNAGLLEQAFVVFSGGVARLRQSMRSRLGLGSTLYLMGKYEEAAQALLETVRLNPKFAPAYDLLGKLFESAPELQDEVLAVFRSYLEQGAEDAAAHCHYAIMLYSRAAGEDPRRFSVAKSHLRRALTLNPRLAEAHVQLGVISEAEGNLAEAVASYRRAAALAPSYATARYRLGLGYQKLGQGAKAKVELDAFRKLKSTESEREKDVVLKRVAAASGK
jgi:tetratricopeptide (TPR) repeat protein